MDNTRTNWLAVVASAIAGVLVGTLWYALLFNKQWMAGNGITMNEAQDKMFKNGVEIPMDTSPMIFNTIAMFAYAFLMNWLLQRANARTLASGATVGAVVGAMSAIGVCIGNMFSMDSSSLSMVDGSYSFVIFTVMGAILGGWQKK